MTFDNHPIPSRFHSLDVIRGLAALTVVIWHWQHFFIGGSGDAAFRQINQPFYAYLSVFYHWGWLAVEFFFSLSGFVFFWLYGQTVAAHKVNGWNFFVARFSRLYPLHLLTFCFVLLAQFWLRSKQGSFFIYPFNDGYHALLNLFMASGWGMEEGPSYNGPIWSVSVEVLLYFMFFVLCYWRLGRPPALLLLTVAGLVMQGVLPTVGRGMISFFAGGLTFFAYDAIRRSPQAPRLALSVVTLALMAWVAVLADFRNGLLSGSLAVLAQFLAPDRLQGMLPELLSKIKLHGMTALLFPMTIMALALIETWRGTLGRRVSFIGHLSYSSYLLHFPLQLCFVIAAGALGIEREFFYSRTSFLLFVGVLIPLCFASYYLIELPMQRYFRRHLITPAAVLAAKKA